MIPFRDALIGISIGALVGMSASFFTNRSFDHPIEQISIPAPVAPVPDIKTHTTAVMQQECREDTTWNTLRELGVEIQCQEQVLKNGIGSRPVNYGIKRAYMPCSRIVRVKVAEGIEVEKKR